MFILWLPVAKDHNFWQILTFGGVSIGLFYRPLAAKKTHFFAIFWTSAFSDVDSWRQSEKVEHGCTTTNLPLPNGIKIISVLQRLHGEIGRTNSDVQMRDGETKRDGQKSVTDRQKTQRFSPTRRRVKSKPHQTWYGDKGPRARSCTSKTFGGLTHSFAARSTENLGVTRLRQIKTPITP